MKVLVIGAIAALGSGYTVTRLGDADKPVKLRVEAASEGMVEIHVPTGHVTIEGWSNNEIDITGTLDDDNANVTLISDHGHAELRILGDNAAVTATLRVRVPQRSNLDIETSSADVSVSGTNGTVRFESIDGDLTVDGHLRGVVARSVTGNITIPASGIPGYAHSEQGIVRLGPGTGNRTAVDRHGAHGMKHTHRAMHPRLGSGELEHVTDIVADVLQSINVEGLVDYNFLEQQLEFDLSGSMNLDLADLGMLFDDMNGLLQDLEYELGDEMEHLGRELERVADDLRRTKRDHRRRNP